MHGEKGTSDTGKCAVSASVHKCAMAARPCYRHRLTEFVLILFLVVNTDFIIMSSTFRR